MLRRSSMASPATTLAVLIRPAITIVEVLLGLRFIFRALASEDSGVVSFVYKLTGQLVAPWRGIVSDTVDGTRVLEWSTLIAMAVYAIAAAFLIRMLRVGSRI